MSFHSFIEVEDIEIYQAITLMRIQNKNENDLHIFNGPPQGKQTININDDDSCCAFYFVLFFKMPNIPLEMDCEIIFFRLIP